MDKSKSESNDAVARLKAKSVNEPIASFLKMRLVELSEGYAKVSLKLSPEYLNFNGLTFGGIIMAIADQAFAYGSNSASFPSVASQFNIYFLTGPAPDDELVAECRVVRSGRRVGISEITVTNQDGKLIAKATGTTIPVSQQV
ncbi:MAG: PaaI family thioesterase [Dehalococcoidales bacterium]|nr:PaaI family thioesterase [Dehalococcoidales bacterium]